MAEFCNVLPHKWGVGFIDFAVRLECSVPAIFLNFSKKTP